MIARGCILMEREEVAVAAPPSPAAVADVAGSTSIVGAALLLLVVLRLEMRRSSFALPAQNFSHQPTTNRRMR